MEGLIILGMAVFLIIMFIFCRGSTRDQSGMKYMINRSGDVIITDLNDTT